MVEIFQCCEFCYFLKGKFYEDKISDADAFWFDQFQARIVIIPYHGTLNHSMKKPRKNIIFNSTVLHRKQAAGCFRSLLVFFENCKINNEKPKNCPRLKETCGLILEYLKNPSGKTFVNYPQNLDVLPIKVASTFPSSFHLQNLVRSIKLNDVKLLYIFSANKVCLKSKRT